MTNILKNEKAVIITGGPGTGKTSVINYLEVKGFVCVHESGRSIIKHQLKINGSKLPWMDREGYAQEMYLQAICDYLRIQAVNAFSFFDRGIPDVIGYLQLCKLPVPDNIRHSAKTYLYNPKVFITPPWREIYVNDTERKQTFEEAVATYQVMVDVYKLLGYEIVEIPKITVAERADFILSRLEHR